MKNSNDTIGNRTQDLPGSSIYLHTPAAFKTENVEEKDWIKHPNSKASKMWSWKHEEVIKFSNKSNIIYSKRKHST
jgi:hypothetical protein